MIVIAWAANLSINSAHVAVDVNAAMQAEIVKERGGEMAGEFSRWFNLVRAKKVAEAAALRNADDLPIVNPANDIAAGNIIKL